MTIDSINTLSLLAQKNDMVQEASGKDLKGNAPVGDGNFKAYLSDAIHSVDTQQVNAEKIKTAYAEADPSVSLSNVMIQMQKAQVSLSALVTVRNKVVDGYKTLMNMSV